MLLVDYLDALDVIFSEDVPMEIGDVPLLYPVLLNISRNENFWAREM